jgi:hypothetical protein
MPKFLARSADARAGRTGSSNAARSIPLADEAWGCDMEASGRRHRRDVPMGASRDRRWRRSG